MTINPFTVVCVLKSGRIYNEEWVYRLRHGVERYAGRKVRFVCLSDVEIPGVETIKLIQEWPKYWSKIELFRKDLFDGPVLYIDLDSIVVGDVSRIMSVRHNFTMTHEWAKGSDSDAFQSSVMAWDGDYSFIYKMFKNDPKHYIKAFNSAGYKKDHNGESKYRNIGDQGFIPIAIKAAGKDVLSFRNYFSENIVSSYKYAKCEEAPPSDAVIVTFHGKSKMDKMNIGWASLENSPSPEYISANSINKGSSLLDSKECKESPIHKWISKSILSYPVRIVKKYI